MIALLREALTTVLQAVAWCVVIYLAGAVLGLFALGFCSVAGCR